MATRFAIDASKERQGRLKISIGVYRCASCRIYYRSNPKFIRPRFLYINKIVNAAVAAAIEDKMPVSRIPHRLERAFGVRPAESVVREWIGKAAAETARGEVSCRQRPNRYAAENAIGTPEIGVDAEKIGKSHKNDRYRSKMSRIRTR